MINRTISWRTARAVEPKKAPNDSEPVSPINTIAGGALNHKKPNPEPINAPARTANSPTPETYDT